MAGAVRRTQQERSDATRALLLDATIDCLVERGYAATTTTEIAKRAGVSRGAQLHHFPAKADLVAAALEHLARQLSAILHEEVARFGGEPPTAADGISALWNRYTGPLFQAWLELWVAARTDEELRAALTPLEERLRHRVVAQLLRLFPPTAGADEGSTSAALAATVFLLQGMALDHTLLAAGPDRDANEQMALDLCTELLAQHLH